MLLYFAHIICNIRRTRQLSREEKTLKSFLDMSSDKWVESSYEVRLPHFSQLLFLKPGVLSIVLKFPEISVET